MRILHHVCLETEMVTRVMLEFVTLLFTQLWLLQNLSCSPDKSHISL